MLNWLEAADRADDAAGEGGDGEAWVAAARSLGGDPSEDEVAAALHRHSARMQSSTLHDPGTIPR
jgi:hypothetical protein